MESGAANTNKMMAPSPYSMTSTRATVPVTGAPEHFTCPQIIQQEFLQLPSPHKNGWVPFFSLLFFSLFFRFTFPKCTHNQTCIVKEIGGVAHYVCSLSFSPCQFRVKVDAPLPSPNKEQPRLSPKIEVRLEFGER